MTKSVLRMPSLAEAESKLERWPDMDPKDLANPQPVQRGINVFDSADGKLSVGIWTCTPMVTTMAPYSVDEFMLVLAGSTTIVHADGRRDTFRAGEAFVIPKGTPCVWEQSEDIAKYYVILSDPDAASAADAASGHAIRSDPKGSGGTGFANIAHADPSLFDGAPPRQQVNEFFANATGRMSAGVWTSPTMRRRHRDTGATELMCILEGAGSLSDDRGNEVAYKAGDSLLLTEGTRNAFACTTPTRKFYCSYDPTA